MSVLTKRLLIAAAILGAIASQALPAEAYDRPVATPSIAPVQCGGPKWIATVRLDVEGVIVDGNPHVQVLSTTAMGLSGAPSSSSASSGSSVRLTISPDEARALGQSLFEWAENPTDILIFSRERKYPAPGTPTY